MDSLPSTPQPPSSTNPENFERPGFTSFRQSLSANGTAKDSSKASKVATTEQERVRESPVQQDFPSHATIPRPEEEGLKERLGKEEAESAETLKLQPEVQREIEDRSEVNRHGAEHWHAQASFQPEMALRTDTVAQVNDLNDQLAAQHEKMEKRLEQLKKEQEKMIYWHMEEMKTFQEEYLGKIGSNQVVDRQRDTETLLEMINAQKQELRGSSRYCCRHFHLLWRTEVNANRRQDTIVLKFRAVSTRKAMFIEAGISIGAHRQSKISKNTSRYFPRSKRRLQKERRE